MCDHFKTDAKKTTLLTISYSFIVGVFLSPEEQLCRNYNKKTEEHNDYTTSVYSRRSHYRSAKLQDGNYSQLRLLLEDACKRNNPLKV